MTSVVLDVGGVLLDWDPRHLYRELFGGDDAAMEHFLATVCTAEWNAAQDAGRSWAEAVALLVEQHPHLRDLIEAYDAHWERMVRGPVPGSVALLAEIREHAEHVYALTNFSADKWALTRSRWPFLADLDGAVVSGEVGLVKPDPLIYRHLLDRFGLAAADTVYVDDVQVNVDAAAAEGLTALLFTGADRLRAELVSLGVLPAPTLG